MNWQIGAYKPFENAWNNFYPEDLPPDWSLDFYANVFPQVVLPISTALSDLEALEDWPEALQLLLLFEKAPDETLLPAVIERLEALQANLAAVLLPAEWASKALHLDENFPELTFGKVFKTYPGANCYCWDEQCLLFMARCDESPKAWRELFEAVAVSASVSCSDVTVIANTDPEVLVTMKTLLELMDL